MRRAGAPGYRITERAGPGRMVPAARREDYFPVSDVDPGREGDLSLGFDLASEPTRREAILRCRDTGGLAATAPVTLVRETEGEHGFLVFIPVYERGKPAESLEDRRRHHRGLIVGVFRLPDLVQEALSYLQPMGIDVSISDDSAPPGEGELLAHSTARPGAALGALRSEAPEGELEHQATLDVAGRRWSVRCFTASGFVAGRRTSYPTAVLLAGLLVTGLLAAYLVASIRRTEELRRSRRSSTASTRASRTRSGWWTCHRKAGSPPSGPTRPGSGWRATARRRSSGWAWTPCAPALERRDSRAASRPRSIVSRRASPSTRRPTAS